MLRRFKNLDFPGFTPSLRKTIVSAARLVYETDYKEVEEGDEVEIVEAPPKDNLKDNAMTGKYDIDQFWGEAEDEPKPKRSKPDIDQLSRYLAIPQELNRKEDILLWWQRHEHGYPAVAKMARQYLACPATSAAAERVFSKAGRFHDDFKKSTKEKTLEDVLMVAINYRGIN